MKYVKNTGRYAIAYTYNQGIRDVKVEFDRQRIYRDTGNIATTGITPVEDEVFEALKEGNKLFNKALEEGSLVLVDEDALVPTDRTAALEKENAALKAQIASKEDTKKLEEENASLRAQLEALAKGKKTKAKKEAAENTEDEGF